MYVQKMIKVIFDLLISILIIILFLPIWLLIAIFIKLDSKGPVFFCQERPGYHEKIFKVYKFRTMKPHSEQMIKGQEVFADDDRVTKIGKLLRRTKIDEIPQLINILKLEMSLVGPRPERISYLTEYTEEERRRFDMRPGLTGLAQVSGNIYLPLADRHRLDVKYVDSFSIVLDIKIILKTFKVIFTGEEKFVKVD